MPWQVTWSAGSSRPEKETSAPQSSTGEGPSDSTPSRYRSAPPSSRFWGVNRSFTRCSFPSSGSTRSNDSHSPSGPATAKRIPSPQRAWRVSSWASARGARTSSQRSSRPNPSNRRS